MVVELGSSAPVSLASPDSVVFQLRKEEEVRYMSGRTIWTLDVNGELRLEGHPEMRRYEVSKIPPNNNWSCVLKTDSKSELRRWLCRHRLHVSRTERPSLVTPFNLYAPSRICYAHFMLRRDKRLGPVE